MTMAFSDSQSGADRRPSLAGRVTRNYKYTAFNTISLAYFPFFDATLHFYTLYRAYNLGLKYYLLENQCSKYTNPKPYLPY